MDFDDFLAFCLICALPILMWVGCGMEADSKRAHEERVLQMCVSNHVSADDCKKLSEGVR